MVRRSKRAVVGLIDFACAIRVQEPIGDDLVVIRRSRRRLDRERRGAALNSGAVDPFLVVEEWDALSTEREAAGEATDVRNVLAELGDED